jgi:hypothetical protein
MRIVSLRLPRPGQASDTAEGVWHEIVESVPVQSAELLLRLSKS